MFFRSSLQRLFQLPNRPIRRKKAGASTRLMEVELLEERRVPAVTSNVNIYITGTAPTVSFTDANRFNDTVADSITEVGNTANWVAANLRSAVIHLSDFTGHTTIFLETNTYKLARGELSVTVPAPNSLTIKDMDSNGNYATITRATESQFRLFEVNNGGPVTMDHLILTGGIARGPFSGSAGQGGAILNHGNLTLTYDQIRGNNADGFDGSSYGGSPSRGLGGGVMNGSRNDATGILATNNAILNIDHSVFDSNRANGGIAGNTTNNGAGAEGGGLCLGQRSGAVSITASTFTNNTANGGTSGTGSGYGGFFAVGGVAGGGAIQSASVANSHLNIVNSTFARNSAYGGFGASTGYGGSGYGGSGFGGAILGNPISTFNLVNDTVAGNNVFAGGSSNHGSGSAYGGGVANLDFSRGVRHGPAKIVFSPPAALPGINVLNTIIAQNKANGANNDIFGSFHSQGSNLVGAATGGGFTQPTDQTGTAANPLDPGLIPLANNGGPTQTMGLYATSHAINKGDNSVITGSAFLTAAGIAPLSTDQRGTGFPRKVGPAVDIGAFEFQLNLTPFYAFHSSISSSVTLTVPPPGLLTGAQFGPNVGLKNFQFFQVVPISAPGPIGGGTSLKVNADGSFTFTVPPRYNNTARFQFALTVGGANGGPTNLVFTATIQVAPGGSRGRDLLGNILGGGTLSIN